MRVYIYIYMCICIYVSIPPLPYQILVIVGIPQLIDPVRLVRGGMDHWEKRRSKAGKNRIDRMGQLYLYIIIYIAMKHPISWRDAKPVYMCIHIQDTTKYNPSLQTNVI